MRQRGTETLVTEEPDELIAHVRICGGGRSGNRRAYPELNGHSHQAHFERLISTKSAIGFLGGV